MGINWRNTFDRYIWIGSPTSAVAERQSGQGISFALSAGSWVTDSDIDKKLAQTGTGLGSTWTFTDCEDNVETYTTVSATQARLVSIRARNGFTQTMVYSGTQLTSVTDSYGRALTFAYLPDGLMSMVTTPDGLVLTYGYGSSGLTPNITSISALR